MKFAAGIILVAVGLILLMVWELYVVPLAYTPTARGTYGEIYGPVSYFRVTTDVVALLLLISGVLLMYLGWRRTNQTPTPTGSLGDLQ